MFFRSYTVVNITILALQLVVAMEDFGVDLAPTPVIGPGVIQDLQLLENDNAKFLSIIKIWTITSVLQQIATALGAILNKI